MAVGISTVSQVPPPIRNFYDRILLRRALPELAYNRFGQQRPIPLNSGDQPKFRRYTALPDAIAPLVEGVTPAAQRLAKTDVTGQLVQYGAYVTITDYVQMTTQDPILTETAELLGENAGQTLDIIYRDTLKGGTTVQYSGTATSRNGVTAQLVAADLRKAIRTLSTNNAKMFTNEHIVGMDRVGTAPIAKAFMAVIDPKTTYDLKGITGYKQVHEYADPSAAMPGEIGAYEQIRFIESTHAPRFSGATTEGGGSATDVFFESPSTATSITVFGMLVFGRDAYGITPLTGKALQNIVKPLGSGNDPLNQRSTSGWKAITDIVILNEAFMLRLEHAVSL
jgi:N4-gp56 family major capsid protein